MQDVHGETCRTCTERHAGRARRDMQDVQCLVRQPHEITRPEMHADTGRPTGAPLPGTRAATDYEAV
eukprot:5007340-Pleurochrysis_carterae.AAC.1